MNNQELVKQLTEALGWTFDSRDGEWIKGDEHKAWSGWNPLTDWNDCMGLVERTLGRLGEIRMKHEFEYRQVIISTPGKSLLHKDKDLKKAICMAVAKALGIELE